MDIFINRKGENLGPFSIKEIRNMLAAGEVAVGDHAWHDGLEKWGPLSRLLESADPLPTPPPPPSADKDSATALPQPSPPPRSSKLRAPGSTPPPAAPPAAKIRHPDADAIVRETASPKPTHRHGVVAMPETIYVRKSKIRNYRFSFLRLFAVPGIALMVYSMFLPWVQVLDEEGGVYTRATAAELSLSEEYGTEPLGVENPKTFPHIVRLVLACALLGCLIVSLLCLKLAFRQDGVLPFAPLVIALATVAIVGTVGVLYGVNLEKSTRTIIGMDVGFYLALAVAVFAVALILIPELARLSQFITLFLPPAAIVGIAAVLAVHGYNIGKRASEAEAEGGDPGTEAPAETHVLKSPAEVLQDLKEYYGEITG